MPAGYAAASRTRMHRLLHFFAISDIHITDKEAPNQLIYLQQQDPANAGKQTSIYSPVMMYTTHVLDAAIQTINVLHQRQAFDFGISLGDTCNSTQYNELRWYLDVIDGKSHHPSSRLASGGHDRRLSKAVSSGRTGSLLSRGTRCLATTIISGWVRSLSTAILRWRFAPPISVARCGLLATCFVPTSAKRRFLVSLILRRA